MIFVDSNIPMYLVGAAHRHKHDAQRLVEQLLSEGRRLITDAEVLQEILHRYGAINRRDAIQPAFDALLAIVDEVIPVDLEAVQQARSIMLGTPRLSARDALHVAVMRQHDASKILSFATGFDGIPGISRLA